LNHSAAKIEQIAAWAMTKCATFTNLRKCLLWTTAIMWIYGIHL